MIQIENINVSYQQTLALDNITLNLEGPSITGIIGPNGAGKSTLIKALIGIIPVSYTHLDVYKRQIITT